MPALLQIRLLRKKEEDQTYRKHHKARHKLWHITGLEQAHMQLGVVVIKVIRGIMQYK